MRALKYAIAVLWVGAFSGTAHRYRYHTKGDRDSPIGNGLIGNDVTQGWRIRNRKTRLEC